ncbi:PREDICTED: putative protein TPRXL [Gekko japonicus]|uniref:Uncharacterized protein n=1 Tax=Gekko japonicus TaxID=146911 RepID=A0ABM1KW19_GEKJA|nr:PREDICTED: putative protein TPRXL [Gekko japonicus]
MLPRSRSQGGRERLPSHPWRGGCSLPASSGPPRPDTKGSGAPACLAPYLQTASLAAPRQAPGNERSSFAASSSPPSASSAGPAAGAGTQRQPAARPSLSSAAALTISGKRQAPAPHTTRRPEAGGGPLGRQDSRAGRHAPRDQAADGGSSSSSSHSTREAGAKAGGGGGSSNSRVPSDSSSSSSTTGEQPPSAFWPSSSAAAAPLSSFSSACRSRTAPPHAALAGGRASRVLPATPIGAPLTRDLRGLTGRAAAAAAAATKGRFPSAAGSLAASAEERRGRVSDWLGLHGSRSSGLPGKL